MADSATCFPNGVNEAGGAVNAGAVAHGQLRVAADVVEAETVTIGGDIYEVAAVGDDTTDDTQGGDFNTAEPQDLFVPKYTTNYPNSPAAVGQLIRLETEVLEIIGGAGVDRFFRRGVSGTTVATHADAVDVFEDATPPVAARIAVGLTATFTPTVFTPALVADINSRGKENVLAVQISVNEILLLSADAVGGNAVGAALALALAETLGGANNEWDTAAMRGGAAEHSQQFGTAVYLVDAEALALGALRIPFPFTPVGFVSAVLDTDGLLREDITDQIVISGDRVEYDLTGITNPVATDVIHVFAWGS